MNALSLLEVIGRGAEKPSEMASRLGTVQTNLSRLLQQLLDAWVLTREVPFGFCSEDLGKVNFAFPSLFKDLLSKDARVPKVGLA